MRNMGKVLLGEHKSSEILMGNYALVRAFIETGTKIVTSYPGSPVAEVAEGIGMIPLNERPFYFEFSTNEIVASEVALGAALNGNLSCVFFKSVGLNVAADCIVQLAMYKLTGGMVVVLGDDPGANSSQNEQDNRHIAKMSYLPVFEPASPSEILQYYKKAAEVSKLNNMPVVLRLTTHVCHAKEPVEFAECKVITNDYKADFDSEKNGPYITLQPNVSAFKKRALERLEKVREWGIDNKMYQTVSNNSSLGIITAGLPFLSLMENIIRYDVEVDILKLGMINPIPDKTILDFLKMHTEIKIIEELDDILEKEIKSLAFDHNIKVKIIGKQSVEDMIGEYKPDKVLGVLVKTWPDLFKKPEKILPSKFYVGKRSPQMCPGCGHRSAFYAVKQALEKTDITIADIGCHTLGFLPPYEIGKVLVCMGASLGVSAGMSINNNTRKVIAFLGDSTFFHAGLPGIINAVFNKHNLTLIIMENKTTAMTGHQDHPAVGKNFNEITEKVSIKSILEGIGIKDITEVDTYQQDLLRDAVIKAKNTPGFNIVIAKHVCMLKFTREHKGIGSQPRQVVIDDKLCNNIEKCIAEFGCPTFSRDENGTIEINADLCIGDGSCIKTCPSKAIKREKQ